MAYIPLSEIISRAIDDNSARDLTNEIAAISRWALDGAIRIGTHDKALPHRERTLNIVDYRAALPTDFYQLVSVSTGSDLLAVPTGKDFRLFSDTSPYLSNPNNNSWMSFKPNTAANFNSNATFTINENYIDLNFKKGTIGLSYTAIPVDPKGLPLINRDHAVAISAYIRYKLISSRYFAEKVSRALYLDAQVEWEKEKTHAQYIDDAVTWPEAQAVARIFSHHLGSPNLNLQ